MRCWGYLLRYPRARRLRRGSGHRGKQGPWTAGGQATGTGEVGLEELLGGLMARIVFSTVYILFDDKKEKHTHMCAKTEYPKRPHVGPIAVFH